jgi:hypothetical protein
MQNYRHLLLAFVAAVALILFLSSVNREGKHVRLPGDLPTVVLPAPPSEAKITASSEVPNKSKEGSKDESTSNESNNILDVINRARNGTSGIRETYLAKITLMDCETFRRFYESARNGLDKQIQEIANDDPLRDKKIQAVKRRFDACINIETKFSLIDSQKIVAIRSSTINSADVKLAALIASQPNSFYTSSSIPTLCDVLLNVEPMPEILGDLTIFLVGLPRSTYLDFPRTPMNANLMRHAATLVECKLGSTNCETNGKWLDQICVVENDCTVSSFREFFLRNLSAEDRKIIASMEVKLLNSIKNRDCKAIGLYQ